MNGLEAQPSRYRSYLWAVGDGAAEKLPEERVQDRYRVVAPQVWEDTQPEARPPVPDDLPATALPYLQAHPHRLHVPGLHGVLGTAPGTSILLLENAPLHPRSGELLPAITEAWIEAAPLRQLDWLWQGWQLWSALQALGVASSLLDLTNLRVEGWRLRLRELRLDGESPPSLEALATAWQSLAEDADVQVRSQLLSLLVDLKDTPESAETFGLQLNQLLLQQAAGRRVRIATAGATDAGPDLPRNEDACYPDGTPPPETAPRLAIVCDGVGGHAGGEVASHLAVQSLQLQLQSLFNEVRSEPEPLPPELITQQIEAVLRIVNDVISHQNDAQGRADRQRMGTTLVMAVVVPQPLQTEAGWTQVEEIYIAHVGDSRAYWLTPDYCHLLTVDDDIAGREVTAGRQPFFLAQQRPDAGALTQAIGTRNADRLHPHIQRFLPGETGVLLLCSDGLSDHQRVEQAWGNYVGLIVKGIVSLEAAVAAWIQLANQKNGHDNTAVVLMLYQTSAKTPPAEKSLATQEDLLQSGLTPSSEALLYGETPEEPAQSAEPRRRRLPLWAWAIAAIVLVGAIGGLWWWTRQSSPDPAPDPLPESEQNDLTS